MGEVPRTDSGPINSFSINILVVLLCADFVPSETNPPRAESQRRNISLLNSATYASTVEGDRPISPAQVSESGESRYVK